MADIFCCLKEWPRILLTRDNGVAICMTWENAPGSTAFPSSWSISTETALEIPNCRKRFDKPGWNRRLKLRLRADDGHFDDCICRSQPRSFRLVSSFSASGFIGGTTRHRSFL